MVGIEDKVWVQIDNFPPVYAIADEDLDRENEEKTSSVHFLRFELNRELIKALQQQGKLSMGIDHPAYQAKIDSIDTPSRASLIKDLACA